MSKATLRAKLRVSSVLHSKASDGSTDHEIVKLQAVYSDDPNSENKQWSKWTPSASFEMQINNPDAFGKLSNGHEFYVDFIPVEAEQAAASA